MLLREIFNNIYYRHTVRVAVLASLSVATAFVIGSAVPDHISPIVASIIALTAIKSTFHDTVKETFKQVVGTIVGAMFGILAIEVLGFNVYSLVLIVVSSILIGVVLKLEVQGGLFIAATVILIAGPLLGDLQLVEERITGVLLGSVCALIVSMFVVPSDKHRRALRRSLSVGENSADILGLISKGLKNNALNFSDVDGLLSKANELLNKINTITDELEGLYRDAKWSPRVAKDDVDAVMFQTNIVRKNVQNIKTILLSLKNALTKNITVNAEVGRNLSKMLSQAKEGILEQLKNAELQPRALISDASVERIRQRRNKVASQLKVSDDTQAIILGSTLIHEANKIKDILGGS